MDLKSKVTSIIEGSFEDESHFLVDVIISAHRGPKKILVLVDGDNGITIDDCARLSRMVGQVLDEDNLVDVRYVLEVSSPGLDHPVSMIRQYKKNVGRGLKVALNDGTETKGKLVEVSESGIILDREVGKGRKKEHERVEFPFSEISKSIVQISFK